MAIKVRIPNAGSTWTVAVAVPSSAGNDVLLHFSTPITSSGCVIFYKGSTSAAGSELFTIALSPAQQWSWMYPINIPVGGIYIVAPSTAGSSGALVMLTNPS